MSNQNPSEENLAEEFRVLGQNLVGALRSAWESPERKQLQQEIENGLSDLAATLHKEATTFKDSPTGQQMKADFDNLHQRVRGTDAEEKIRSELLNVLRTINTELERVSNRWTPDEPVEPNEPPQQGA